MTVAVVILAGGEGSRMGGAKPLRMLAGRRLIDHALGLARTWSHDIAVAARSNDQLPDVGAPLLVDEMDRGPISGLASAFAFARSHDGLLTIPCDTPLLPLDLLDRLAAADAAAAMPVSGERAHPSCIFWRQPAGAALPSYLETGRSSLWGFAEHVGCAQVAWPAEPFDPFLNINSEEDLAAAETILRSR